MKEYGAKMTLPVGDTLRAAHLLGEDFSHTRWFPSLDARDLFLEKYNAQYLYYRLGDLTRYDYECVEREHNL